MYFWIMFKRNFSNFSLYKIFPAVSIELTENLLWIENVLIIKIDKEDAVVMVLNIIKIIYRVFNRLLRIFKWTERNCLEECFNFRITKSGCFTSISKNLPNKKPSLWKTFWLVGNNYVLKSFADFHKPNE